MGGKGGKPTATNDQMVQMQMQQSQQAAEANAERNARLQYGTQQISNIFQGTPSGATPVDLSGIASGAVQPGAAGTHMAGWVAVSDPGGGAHWEQQSTPGLPAGYSYNVMPDSGSGAVSYGLYGPQGLITTASTPQDLAKAQVYSGGDPSQTTGGFDQSFYDKFRNAVTGYYMPQEQQQLTEARTGLSYNLARAGQLNSSNAATDIAKLAQQDKLNQAQIASQADQQTAGLRNTVQQDQQQALNQLYSTEDPTVAANTAQNMVASANLTKPILNPVGALFAPITAGVGTALTGFTNPAAYINPNQGLTSASTPSGSQPGGVNIAGNA
jgi:hypothetical protein